ncbi:MAG: hypothetical protein COA69_10380 [Robiginitomaculum sp.]|nr:MAG: hypothetical protein COA69_10380 [Robiginitomaculum sp.]
MATAKTLAFVSVGAILAASSVVAVAQSNSPFASKKPKAWEVQSSQTQTGQPQPAAPQTQTGTPYQYKAPVTYSAPQQNQQQPYLAPEQLPQPAPQYQAPPQYQASQYQAPTGGAVYQLPSSNARPVATQTAPIGHYPGRQPTYTPPSQNNYSRSGVFNQGIYATPQPTPPVTSQPQPVYAGAQYGAPATSRTAARPSWADRMGFTNLQTRISGSATAGVAAVKRSGADTKAETIVDLDLRVEVSAITDGGLEYGAGLRARAQRDKYRRGFGGRVGDCPVTNLNCVSALVGADTRPVKGHTGQFYTDGPADVKENELALEGAYLFLRSSYGDVVVGRDDGAAYLFSLGAPSLVAVGGSNSGVDYTGLDSVKTTNDASGFAEKITYTSPRLLGDNVGVGVQIGLSYAPNARACGVNYCVRKNATGANDIFAPEITDIIEAGVSFDRTFASGMSVELTGTYAHGSEKTGNPVFTSLSTWGAGLEFKYADFVFGSSYLNSNNGFAGDGDYTAYDAGLTWQPSRLGFSASYGHAKDGIARLKSDQGVFAISYDFGKFRLGTGVQYIRRKTPSDTGLGIVSLSEDATALFIEGGVKF